MDSILASVGDAMNNVSMLLTLGFGLPLIGGCGSAMTFPDYDVCGAGRIVEGTAMSPFSEPVVETASIAEFDAAVAWSLPSNPLPTLLEHRVSGTPELVVFESPSAGCETAAVLTVTGGWGSSQHLGSPTRVQLVWPDINDTPEMVILGSSGSSNLVDWATGVLPSPPANPTGVGYRVDGSSFQLWVSDGDAAFGETESDLSGSITLN